MLVVYLKIVLLILAWHYVTHSKRKQYIVFRFFIKDIHSDLRELHVLGYIYLLLLLFKKVGCARPRESDIHPVSPKSPTPQYQPIDRKKRKGKIVEDYSRERAASDNKKALALLLKPVSPHHRIRG